MEMLGRSQGKPRWEDEPVWWLWRELEYQGGLGKIHKNKRQSLGFEQSLTGVWKNHRHTVCLQIPVNTHIHPTFLLLMVQLTYQNTNKI